MAFGLGAIATVGASIIGGVLGGGDKAKTPKVKPMTTSGQQRDETDIMFDEQAKTTLKNLATKMSDWGDLDRDFMENQYRPFQEELIATNTGLINMIGKNSKVGLEQSIKDLTGGEALKDAFRSTIGETGAQISETANRFMTELNNLPTTEQRIGQAASAVEQQFGKAAADIRGRLKAQGRNVSQATERDLAIQKASAKAGAVGAAGEAARAERMGALSQGVGVFSNVQASASNQLSDQVNQAQAGVGLLPQVGGITEPDQTAAGIGADLQTGLGLTQTGVNKTGSDIEIVQKGAGDGKFPGLPDGVGSRDMIAEEKAKADKAIADAKAAAANDNTTTPSGPEGNGVASGQGWTSQGTALGGVGFDNQPNRSGSGGQGGFQQ